MYDINNIQISKEEAHIIIHLVINLNAYNLNTFGKKELAIGCSEILILKEMPRTLNDYFLIIRHIVHALP